MSNVALLVREPDAFEVERRLKWTPGWQDSSDKDACWYLICAGTRANGR